MKIILVVMLCFAALKANATTPFEDGMKEKSLGRFAEAEISFQKSVNSNSADQDALEQMAIVQSWQQKFDASISSWRKLIALNPKEAKFRLGLARVLYWKGDLPQAGVNLKSVLKANPNNLDALILAGDVQMAAGKVAAAQKIYSRAAKLDPSNQDVQTKLARAVPPRRFRLDAGYSLEKFSNYRGTEDSEFLQLGYRLSETLNAWLRVENQNSFLQNDKTVAVGVADKVLPKVLLIGEGAFTPANKVKASTVLNLNSEIYVVPDLTPLLGYRRMIYNGVGVVGIYQLGVRWNFLPKSDLEVRYNLSHNTDGSKTSTYQVKAARSFLENWLGYVAYAHGQEALPPQSTATTTYYSLGVSWDDLRFGARLDYSFEDRQDTYAHSTFSVGGNLKF